MKSKYESINGDVVKQASVIVSTQCYEDGAITEVLADEIVYDYEEGYNYYPLRKARIFENYNDAKKYAKRIASNLQKSGYKTSIDYFEF